MILYLYVIDGKPLAHTELTLAQGVLEEHLRERQDVSDVWWDEERPYWARLYLYGPTHSNYIVSEDSMEDDISWEETDQLIWPVELAKAPQPPEPLEAIEPTGARLSLHVSTHGASEIISRAVPKGQWPRDMTARRRLLLNFVTESALNLGDRWKKEGL